MELVLSVFFAGLTFELAKTKILNPISASALVGLLGSLFMTEQYSAIAYGASFVGMCSSFIFSRAEVLTMGLFYYPCQSLLGQLKSGVGGTLGASAFISVLIVKGVKNLYISRKKNRVT